jgi:HEAT repeat protein
LVWAVAAVVVVALFAMLTPGSPVYIADWAVSKDQHGGHSTAYWREALQSPDGNVRHQAIFALGAIGPKAGVAVPALAVILVEDADVKVRSEAALALSKMDPASAAAVPALARALQDEGPVVRLYAALALFRLRAQARPAVPALIKALKDGANKTFINSFSMTVGEMMVCALGRASAGTAEGVPALMEALQSADRNAMRVAAARALGEIGPEAHPAAPLLEVMLRDQHPQIKEAAQEALRKIKAGPAPDRNDTRTPS